VSPPVEDIRDIAAVEPPAVEEEMVRVPSRPPMRWPTRSAGSQRALAEIQEREAADAERELYETRVDQLVRWHEDDQVAQQEAGLDDGVAMEVDTP
jgi:hypothetical protein